MLLLVFRKVYICNIMSHTNIMQAEENDLVNILSLQKKSFMVVAERMNKFDLPPLLQNQDEICVFLFSFNYILISTIYVSFSFL